MALASRLAREKVATALQWRLPSNLLQTFNFSAESSSAATTTTTTSGEASKNTKRRKNKNLFEVAQFLPNWGLGYHMAKTHWTNVSYEITKINLYKDGRHGKAWGLAYKDGIPAPAPKKISGVHKRCWKYISNPLKVEAKPKPEAEAA
ncbi:uncharacterized protein LOC110688340 [Chenopodium quinoa]|uniref:Uncharacterized protein n=1 Tax=Chenopodium quinoa TaxID=63459 RepID=A0A803KRQ8_CHEQI|nr:uncharacterized protein LOC110688340 [Chenopodium quinoa]